MGLVFRDNVGEQLQAIYDLSLIPSRESPLCLAEILGTCSIGR